jgi:uncharacterized protein
VELRGAVGILTGASRGIGALLAEQLARAGVDLVLAARSSHDLAATATRVEESGARAVPVPTDVTKRTDLELLATRAAKELGPVDLLINNAGIEHYAHFERMDLDVIANILTTNLLAAELLTRLVLPGMVARRRGHIVNMASVAGKTAVPYNTVYSSSKHGLIGFSWSLREEMRPHGVGVTVVCPSFVSETGMFADRTGGEVTPSVAHAVTPDDVVRATVKAIEQNRSEVVVAKGLARISDIAAALSPELSARIARRTGVYDFLESSTQD